MATVTTFSNVTDSEFVARAQAFAPKLRERSEATNALGRVPREIIDEMLDAGLFTLLQPKRFGGTERGLVPFLDCVTALAAGCGSAGWVYSVVEIHSFHLGLFGLEAQGDVWGDDHTTILGSSYMPGGKATPAPGGYRISGHWKFSSGCDNVEWFILGGLAPPASDGQPPQPYHFLLPAKDVKIHHDSWKVVGLTGTGSKDLSVEDAFVPHHRMLLMQDAYDGISPGSKVNPYPLYHLPMMSVFPLCLSAPGVGVAKGAVQRYIEMMKTFTTKSRGQTVADFHNSQMRLAEASALVDSAELLLQRDVRETMSVRATRQLTIEERVRNRRDHAWAAETSVRAVDLLYKMTGGAGLHEGNALLRSFRDAHGIGMHLGNNWDVAGPLYGSVMLGRPPTGPTY
jgi:3-hydroxy-9,10-secoandrosta-1,3,5(10)-triene-9,17-dione monooxygenase